MAKYTIQLRTLCDLYGRETIENYFKQYELSDFLLPKQLELVQNSPIWSKDKLAKKIVDHFYMSEIGFETPALFQHYAKITMLEIMESKLPLIYTTCIEYDPLVNVDFTETFERKATGTAKNTGSADSSSTAVNTGLNVYSDTPQGQINKQQILQGNYASNTSASETDNTVTDLTSTTNNGTSENEENYTRHLKGNQGISATYQAMIKQFRDNIRAVDYEIIEELKPLFMGIF